MVEIGIRPGLPTCLLVPGLQAINLLTSSARMTKNVCCVPEEACASQRVKTPGVLIGAGKEKRENQGMIRMERSTD